MKKAAKPAPTLISKDFHIGYFDENEFKQIGLIDANVYANKLVNISVSLFYIYRIQFSYVTHIHRVLILNSNLVMHKYCGKKLINFTSTGLLVQECNIYV